MHKQISFNQPNIQAHISNKEPYTHIFTALNLGPRLIKVVEVKTGCGCTTYKVPDEIQPYEEFEVKLTVDKTGLSGLYSTFISILFDTGQKETLKLGGKLQEE